MIVVDNLFFLDNKNNDYQLQLTFIWYYRVTMRHFFLLVLLRILSLLLYSGREGIFRKKTSGIIHMDNRKDHQYLHIRET